MLLWLGSVCWVRTLNTPKWDILATGVDVYFDSKLRKLKLQAYQSTSSAKGRENHQIMQKIEKMCCRGRENSLAENASQRRRWTTFLIAISISRIIETSARHKLHKIIYFGKINSLSRCPSIFTVILSVAKLTQINVPWRSFLLQ